MAWRGMDLEQCVSVVVVVVVGSLIEIGIKLHYLITIGCIFLLIVGMF